MPDWWAAIRSSSIERGTIASFENSSFVWAKEIHVKLGVDDTDGSAKPRNFNGEIHPVSILKFILALAVAAAAVVALVIATIFARQGIQLARFRLSMRSFAKDDAQEDDDALDVPESKGTLEEERERLEAVYELFYRPGLSVAKLRAAKRLREKQAFVRPEWIEAEEWRGWHRLATQGSKEVRAYAADHARREGERRIANLEVRDLPLWLELFEEKKHPELKIRWASRNIASSRVVAALAIFDELGNRKDEIGAKALYQAFLHFATKSTRLEALKWAERYLHHSGRSHEEVVRSKLLEIFTPDLEDPVESPKFWSISSHRMARLVARVHALDIRGADETWLESPQMPLNQAALGPVLWEHTLSSPRSGLFDEAEFRFRCPKFEGPIQVEVIAQFPEPRGWSACMGKEEMPVARRFVRRFNTSMDAVLTVTESALSVWVVDNQTRAPIPDVSVRFLRRNKEGKIDAEATRTDENGLFTWKGKATWQFGVLIERDNSSGRRESLFLTNNDDISTSREATPVRRYYVMLSRPLYRPGERVQGKLFARQKGSEGSSKRVATNQTLKMDLMSPRGPKITTISCTLSEFGTASFDVPIPADAPLGRYTFKMTSPSGAVEGCFNVEEYVAPEFRADLRSEKKPVWGNKLILEFEARYFFGGPVANATGTLEIRRIPWRYRHVHHGSFSKWFRSSKHLGSQSFTTDDQGKAKIEIPWRGPWSLFGQIDGCDFNFAATVRDASGKSCEASLHVSVPKTQVVVSAKPVKKLRIPGETLPLNLAWEPADPGDEKLRKLTIVCRKGWSKKTFIHEVRRIDSDLELPLELPAGNWNISAHVEGQPQRGRTSHEFTLLGKELRERSRRVIVSNDPTDSQGTIRIALTGPNTYCSHELLVWNRGPRLGSKVIERNSPTTWFDLPYLAGAEDKVHLHYWYFDPREAELNMEFVCADIEPLVLAPEAPVELTLAFPGETLRPGEETSLEAKLSVDQDKPSELSLSVVDEAIYSLVSRPKSAKAFFEESPPKPSAYAAWSVLSARAQVGRRPDSYYAARGSSQDLPVMGGLPGNAPMLDMPMAMPMAAAPMMDRMPMARKSAGPLQAMAAVAAAPVALVGAGAGLVAEAAGSAARRREADGLLEQQEASAMAEAAEVPVRSDFSSEAAWIPNARFPRGQSLTLPIKLPDTLTTWTASAIVVSLAHDHILEAKTQVRTQKPLMIRLQTPRFFQERDELALRALVDSRSDTTLDVHTFIEAEGFSLPESARKKAKIKPNGQDRVDVNVIVPVCQTREVLVRAKAVATNSDDAKDAEQRSVPYRPYGMLLRKTIAGTLEDEKTVAEFELPENRIQEHTSLSIQIDRGPLDAVVHALSYLREYPYGCVEQTCSRLMPHLVLEEMMQAKEQPFGGYRKGWGKFPPDVVQETLRRISSMQNDDGGFGWWPGGSSDLWMTAYVVFTFSLASQPIDSQIERARKFLTLNLLRRDHSDDADAFAAFALTWTKQPVTDRVLDVLASRWENLSLTEQVKLGWVFMTRGYEGARERSEELKKALVGPAKRFLKKIAKEENENRLQWYHPGSTEAIAFYLLGLLRERQEDIEVRNKHFMVDDESLDVLVSFLLQHRQGKRWHNTRDSALAVFALLQYDDLLHGDGPDRDIEIQINAEKKRTEKLERLGAEPLTMLFEDNDLRAGRNEVAFVLDETPRGVTGMRRHFQVELEYYTQETKIAATSEGMEIERTYWLLDEKKEVRKKLANGDSISVGQFLRVLFKVKATKRRTYVLLEDRKLAGCEPVAKKSGRDVCKGRCAHVELRADRTAIFFDSIDTDEHEVSYDIEAILPGSFTAMPARIDTMYEARCSATSTSFALKIVPE